MEIRMWKSFFNTWIGPEAGKRLGPISSRKAALLALLCVLSGYGMSGCGYGAYVAGGVVNGFEGNVVDHSFEFNVDTDSPGIELLDYEYSTRKPTRDQLLGEGGNSVKQTLGTTGFFPRGDFVNMKWRIRVTGDVFEDRVDLRQWLPTEIRGQRIYCVIDRKQLYVLLMPLDYFREKVTTEELEFAKAQATTPLKKVLVKKILYHVKQIYPDPIAQLQ
jgi:hypothetical protein